MKHFGDMDSFFCINIVQSVKSWTQVTCVREHSLKQTNYLNDYHVLCTLSMCVWVPVLSAHSGTRVPSFIFSGYGHIHPLTNTGKTACILYAIIGIPFTLIFLSALVQRLLAPTFKLLSSFIKMLPNMDTFRVRTIFNCCI